MLPIQQIRFSSPIGLLVVQSRNNKIIRLLLDPNQTPTPDLTLENSSMMPECLIMAKKQINEYFSGSRKSFDLPYDIPFQGAYKNLLEAMISIPYGETVSYTQLACLAGISRGARAAGTVCTKNPLPILIPCHRVIRKDGAIGEYSFGGAENKGKLLTLEHYLD